MILLFILVTTVFEIRCLRDKQSLNLILIHNTNAAKICKLQLDVVIVIKVKEIHAKYLQFIVLCKESGVW